MEANLEKTLILSVLVLFSMYCSCLGEEPIDDKRKPIRSMQVFGDSIVDTAVSTDRDVGMKAGYLPYGFDCMFVGANRFTNGRTVPEMIAISIGISVPVPLDMIYDSEGELGVNYASASAGILPETGRALGKNHDVGKQIGIFKETLEKYLKPKFPSKDALLEFLSDSVYVINIGTSDYIHNYLQPDKYNSSRLYNGNDFAELLTSKLAKHIKDLYRIGARKFVIFQIGPFGCLPFVINKVKPRSRCDKKANNLASIFNQKLDVKLKELSSKLENFRLVTVRTFQLIEDMVEYPFRYGLKATRWPCCATQKNGTGLCESVMDQYLAEVNSSSSVRKSEGESKYDKQVSTAATSSTPDPEDSYDAHFHCLENPLPPAYDPKLVVLQPEQRTTVGVCGDRGFHLFWDELHLTKVANRIIANKCIPNIRELEYSI